MKQKWSVVYTVATVLAFLAIAIYVLLSLNAAREEAFRDAETAFAAVVETLSSSDVEEVGRSIIRRYPAIRAILVRSDGDLQYLYAEQPRLLGEGADRLRDVRSLETSSLGETLLVDADGDVTVEAVFRLIDDRASFRILRDALLLVLGFSLVVVFVLLVVALRARSVVAAAEPDRGTGSKAQSTQKIVLPPLADEEEPPRSDPARWEPAPPGDAEEPEGVREAAGQAGEVDETDDLESTGDAGREADDSDEIEAGSEGSTDSPGATVDAADESVEPTPAEAGLFSPRTGLSYRAHLERRLEQEIQRAAFNEEDVTVALVSFPGLMATDTEYQELAKGLLSSFRFAELIFEFEDDSFCLILPNSNLDDAIRRVTDFLRKYDDLAAHSGLSSRNGRLVDAQRILAESERALKKAESESAPVMGFRSDPDLYRSYLSQSD